MKTYLKISVVAFVFAMWLPLNSHAYSFSCFGSKLIDLRGNSDIDGVWVMGRMAKLPLLKSL